MVYDLNCRWNRILSVETNAESAQGDTKIPFAFFLFHPCFSLYLVYAFVFPSQPRRHAGNPACGRSSIPGSLRCDGKRRVPAVLNRSFL